VIGYEGTWDLSASGVLRRPSGRLLRGRGLRQPVPDDAVPQFALYLPRQDAAAGGLAVAVGALAGLAADAATFTTVAQTADVFNLGH